jgi:DNA replication protein DnaC
MQLEHLLEQLTQLKLVGFATELREQFQRPDINKLYFEERLSMLLEREILHKEDKRLSNLLRQAKLRQKANIESVTYSAKRQLERTQIMSLASCNYIKHQHNIVITGPTGCGKSYLACAFGDKACRLGYKVRYLHLPRFIESLSIAHVDGSYLKLMKDLNKFDLLILDDFGLTSITSNQCHDLFNLIEERHELKSTIITSQLPVNKWHEYLGEPTLADAILDRLLQHVQRVEIAGESMRKAKKVETA